MIELHKFQERAYGRLKEPVELSGVDDLVERIVEGRKRVAEAHKASASQS